METNSYKGGFILIWALILPFVILLMSISITLYRLNSQANILHRESSISIARDYSYGCAVFIARRISRGEVKFDLSNSIGNIKFRDNTKCNYSIENIRQNGEVDVKIVIEFENIHKKYRFIFLIDKFLIKILSFLEE